MANKESTAEQKSTQEEKEVIVRERQNDVTRPSEGTKTRTVWDICDELTGQTGMTAPRGEVMKQCTEKGINKATVATQYGLWCRFNGINRTAERQAEAEKKAEAKTKAKVEKEKAKAEKAKAEKVTVD